MGDADAGGYGGESPGSKRHPAQQVHVPLSVRGVAAPRVVIEACGAISLSAASELAVIWH